MAPERRSPRVLEFVDALLAGGAERLVVELATRVDRGRFDPAVACFRQEAFADALEAAERPVFVVPKRRAFDLRLVLALRRLVRREGVGLVHCHDLQSATYGLLAGRLARVPVVMTVHGVRVFGQKRSRFLLPRLGRWLHAVVFVGRWLERAAAEDHGVRPRHARVIHNGVDLAAFRPGERAPALERELGIAPGTPVVGTVGTLRPVKDHPTLLRAFQAVRARQPQAVLVLVGDGPQRGALEALAAELGLAEAIRFLGARGDVAALLRGFDLFALPSRTEGISVALLEAMATGLPVVATATGGNPEVVAPGETGLLVPVGDADALGRALADLLADEPQRRAFGHAARRRVEQHFSLDRMVSEYEALYDQLLRRR